MTAPLRLALFAALASLVLVPRDTAAAESDQYYAWRVLLRDSGALFSATVTRHYEATLSRINRRPNAADLACTDVAAQLMSPLIEAGSWYPLGATRDWGLCYAPATNTEFVEDYAGTGVYRRAVLWPIGFLGRTVPTVKLAGVHVGLDKIGHFFAEGRRYLRSYRAARDAGKSVVEAERAAIEHGVRWERGAFGWLASGIFSYADLEADWQSFQHVRDLCEGDDPQLVLDDDDGWRLVRPFDIAAYVNPCWDESFNPNGLADRHIAAVQRSLLEMCPLFHSDDVQQRRARLRAQGCHSTSHHYLRRRVARGELPDPGPVDIERVCRAAPRLDSIAAVAVGD